METNPNKERIDYEDYLKVEDWYLTEAIDKNIANILKVASKHRKFVESILFSEKTISFKIDRPAIKDLHVNGLIKKGRMLMLNFGFHCIENVCMMHFILTRMVKVCELPKICFPKPI
ncbi:MAG: hypothetical protein H7A23_25715 [Leptospiraceae bacterium]|nr:hypothetical protein [Leptospiraceae bacterium]